MSFFSISNIQSKSDFLNIFGNISHFLKQKKILIDFLNKNCDEISLDISNSSDTFKFFQLSKKDKIGVYETFCYIFQIDFLNQKHFVFLYNKTDDPFAFDHFWKNYFKV